MLMKSAVFWGITRRRVNNYYTTPRNTPEDWGETVCPSDCSISNTTQQIEIKYVLGVKISRVMTVITPESMTYKTD
jgi:hypothetical protein